MNDVLKNRLDWEVRMLRNLVKAETEEVEHKLYLEYVKKK